MSEEYLDVVGTAMYDFTKSDDEEISIAEGDSVTVLKEVGDWLFIRNDGSDGYVPATYIEWDKPDSSKDESTEPNEEEKDENSSEDDNSEEEEEKDDDSGEQEEIERTAIVLYALEADDNEDERKELTVKKDEKLIILKRENEWVLCRNSDGNEGYVPAVFLSEEKVETKKHHKKVKRDEFVIVKRETIPEAYDGKSLFTTVGERLKIIETVSKEQIYVCQDKYGAKGIVEMDSVNRVLLPDGFPLKTVFSFLDLYTIFKSEIFFSKEWFIGSVIKRIENHFGTIPGDLDPISHVENFKFRAKSNVDTAYNRISFPMPSNRFWSIMPNDPIPFRSLLGLYCFSKVVRSTKFLDRDGALYKYFSKPSEKKHEEEEEEETEGEDETFNPWNETISLEMLTKFINEVEIKGKFYFGKFSIDPRSTSGRMFLKWLILFATYYGSINHFKKAFDLCKKYQVNFWKKKEFLSLISCAGNQLDILKHLINDLKTKPDFYGNRLISEASMRGQLNTIKYLLEFKEVNPASHSFYGIRYGTLNNHFDTVKLLLKDERVKPSPASIDDYMYANISKEGNLEALKFCLEEDKLKIVDLRDTQTLLQASLAGHMKFVKLLLKKGRCMPLDSLNLIEIARKDPQIVDMILQKISDVKRYEVFPTLRLSQIIKRCFHIACQKDCPEIIPILLKHEERCNKEVCKIQGDKEAFKQACIYGSKKIAVYFTSSPDNISMFIDCIPDEDFSEIISYTAMNGWYKILYNLLNRKKESELTDSEMENIKYAVALSLFETCRNGYVPLFKYLLDKVEEIGEKEEEFYKDISSPLELCLSTACWRNHYDIVELLINDTRSFIPKLSVQNNIALRYCCEKGNIRILECLLDQKDEEGRTVCDPTDCRNFCLRIAIEKDRKDIIKLLMTDNRVNFESIGGMKKIIIDCCVNGRIGVLELLLEKQKEVLLEDDFLPFRSSSENFEVLKTLFIHVLQSSSSEEQIQEIYERFIKLHLYPEIRQKLRLEKEQREKEEKEEKENELDEDDDVDRLMNELLSDLEKEIKEDEEENDEDEEEITCEDYVTQGICTYKLTKSNFKTQKWYHCITCGMTDNSGICESCLDNCHMSHETIVSPKSPSLFYCDCGEKGEEKCSALKDEYVVKKKKKKKKEEKERENIEKEISCSDYISQGICTYKLTKSNYRTQKWYHCLTCGMTGNFGICESCLSNCHKSHETVEAASSPSAFFCDCGGREEFKCSSMNKEFSIIIKKEKEEEEKMKLIDPKEEKTEEEDTHLRMEKRYHPVELKNRPFIHDCIEQILKKRCHYNLLFDEMLPAIPGGPDYDIFFAHPSPYQKGQGMRHGQGGADDFLDECYRRKKKWFYPFLMKYCNDFGSLRVSLNVLSDLFRHIFHPNDQHVMMYRLIQGFGCVVNPVRLIPFFGNTYNNDWNINEKVSSDVMDDNKNIISTKSENISFMNNKVGRIYPKTTVFQTVFSKPDKIGSKYSLISQQNPNKLLNLAFETGDVNLIKIIKQQFPHFNIDYTLGGTNRPIRLSCERGFTSMIELLITEGKIFNLEDHHQEEEENDDDEYHSILDEEEALEICCRDGQGGPLKVIIEKCNEKIENYVWEFLLKVAVTNGHSGIVDILVNHVLSLEKKQKQQKKKEEEENEGEDEEEDIISTEEIFKSIGPSFCIACESGHVELVRYICQSQHIKNIYISMNLGNTPAKRACENGNLEVLKILKEHGVYIIDEACVKIACKNSHVDVVKYLLENKLCKFDTSKSLQQIICKFSSIEIRCLHSMYPYLKLDEKLKNLEEVLEHYSFESLCEKVNKRITEMKKSTEPCRLLDEELSKIRNSINHQMTLKKSKLEQFITEVSKKESRLMEMKKEANDMLQLTKKSDSEVSNWEKTNEIIDICNIFIQLFESLHSIPKSVNFNQIFSNVDLKIRSTVSKLLHDGAISFKKSIHLIPKIKHYKTQLQKLISLSKMEEMSEKLNLWSLKFHRIVESELLKIQNSVSVCTGMINNDREKNSIKNHRKSIKQFEKRVSDINEELREIRVRLSTTTSETVKTPVEDFPDDDIFDFDEDDEDDDDDDDDDSKENEKETNKDDSKDLELQKQLNEELEKLLESKKEHLNKIHQCKRRCETNSRSIHVLASKTLSFMKLKLVRKKEDQFIQLLKSKGLWITGRSKKDYVDWKMVSKSQGEVFIARLKGDFMKEARIVKILRYDERNIRLTQNEIKILVSLGSHPSIMELNCVFIFSDDDGHKKLAIEMNYFRMDLLHWMKGKTFMRRDGLDSSDQIGALNHVQEKKNRILVLKKVLESIAYIHSKGIQHRDLKPSNILLNNEFEIRLIDFGISRQNLEKTITRNQSAHTLRYLSPDEKVKFILESSDSYQTIGEDYYEARDIFAFGVMLLEALAPGEIFQKIPSLLGEYPLGSDADELFWKNVDINTQVEKEALLGFLNRDSKKRVSAKQGLKFDIFNATESGAMMMIAFQDSVSSPTQSFSPSSPIPMGFMGGPMGKEISLEEISKKVIRKDNVDVILTNLEEHVQKTREEDSIPTYDIYIDRKRSKNEEQVQEQEEQEVSNNNNLSIFFQQSVMKWNQLSDVLCSFSTKFSGEEAIDAGGVTRELFSYIFELISSEKYCDQIGSSFFLPTDTHLLSDTFIRIGMFCCKCFLERKSFRVPFGPLLYSFILNQEPKNEDEWVQYTRLYDPEYIRNLNRYCFDPRFFQSLLDEEEVFDDEDDLEIRLTPENKRLYYITNIKNKMKGKNGFRMKNILSFKKGFSMFLPSQFSLQMMFMLNPFELNHLIFGDTSLPSDVLMKNIDFESGTDHFISKYMKKFFEEHEEYLRWDFVRFCCGNASFHNGCLIVGGEEKKIAVNSDHTKNCFFGHTCYCSVDVGNNYEAEGMYLDFEKRIKFCLEEFKVGGMEE